MRLQVRIPLWAEVFLIFFQDPNTILGNRRPGFSLRKYGTLILVICNSILLCLYGSND
uniref:Uncharacterized protein n=1 Tax=Amphimedon queenslandica TaxID=400682 RepID=A0A1X7VG09_AMPQE